ncbi:hypothetical protein ACLOJK_034826 [Asimina triloba]
MGMSTEHQYGAPSSSSPSSIADDFHGRSAADSRVSTTRRPCPPDQSTARAAPLPSVRKIKPAPALSIADDSAFANSSHAVHLLVSDHSSPSLAPSSQIRPPANDRPDTPVSIADDRELLPSSQPTVSVHVRHSSNRRRQLPHGRMPHHPQHQTPPHMASITRPPHGPLKSNNSKA